MGDFNEDAFELLWLPYALLYLKRAIREKDAAMLLAQHISRCNSDRYCMAEQLYMEEQERNDPPRT